MRLSELMRVATAASRQCERTCPWLRIRVLPKKRAVCLFSGVRTHLTLLLDVEAQVLEQNDRALSRIGTRLLHFLTNAT